MRNQEKEFINVCMKATKWEQDGKRKDKKKKEKEINVGRLDWIGLNLRVHCALCTLSLKHMIQKWQIMSLIVTIIDGCKRSEKKWFCAVRQCCCMKLIELMVWWLQILCVCYETMFVLTTGSQLSSNFWLTFILFPFSFCHYYFFNLML